MKERLSTLGWTSISESSDSSRASWSGRELGAEQCRRRGSYPFAVVNGHDCGAVEEKLYWSISCVYVEREDMLLETDKENSIL
jgi:hypothetical protein